MLSWASTLSLLSSAHQGLFESYGWAVLAGKWGQDVIKMPWFETALARERQVCAHSFWPGSQVDVVLGMALNQASDQLENLRCVLD